jgi:hypothetical protein
MKIIREEQNKNILIEKVAELCHIQWSNWMKHLFSKSKDLNEEIIILDFFENQWKYQIKTSYKDLSEEDKEKDRREALKFIDLFKQYKELL